MAKQDDRKFKEIYDKIIALDGLPTHQEVLDLIQFSERNFAEGNGKVNKELFGIPNKYLFVRKNCFGGYEGGLWGKVYHIWTQEFIEALADHIRGFEITGPLVEIGAGNGKLSYWLRKNEIEIVATDPIPRYQGDPVEQIDHFETLRKYRPEFVLTSWSEPPHPLNEKKGPRIQESIIDNSSTNYYIEIRGIYANVDRTGLCAERCSQFDVSHPIELQRYSLPIDILANTSLDPSSQTFKQDLESCIIRKETVSSWRLRE